ncbi:LysR family transcriptional regulator [Pseudomonas sp. R3-52-08]|uniref:LysR family transcriptional regulator n=1 Tax=Pseudomonas sp. R3-52-08 TaxID=1173284 RepID=UPI000F56EF2F|nr:LysR family transcriptional regulator [Pseudomonas sp. R3-52-08]AZF21183.1 Glycine cleavage system transcriptional activator [Pseudomonas sp. R3-52-08]
MKGTSLNSIRAFEAVSRHLSFTNAANELGVSQSAISQHIKNLEMSIGCSLLKRDTKRIALTIEGGKLAEVAQRWICDIQHVVESLSLGNRFKITVAAPSIFTISWLLPKLNEFYSVNPDSKVELVTSDSPSFSYDRNLDLVIKFDKEDLPGFDLVGSYKSKLLVVASEKYIRDFGLFLGADNFSSHKLLAIQPGPWLKNTGSSTWSTMGNFLSKTLICEPQFQIYEDVNLAYAAALHGQGWVILDYLLVEDDISSGRLRPMPDVSCASDIHVFQRQNSLGGMLIIFYEWLHQKFSSSELASFFLLESQHREDSLV